MIQLMMSVLVPSTLNFLPKFLTLMKVASKWEGERFLPLVNPEILLAKSLYTAWSFGRITGE
jgi:hypothetical protein